jgi:hypothetical protein
MTNKEALTTEKGFIFHFIKNVVSGTISFTNKSWEYLEILLYGYNLAHVPIGIVSERKTEETT